MAAVVAVENRVSGAARVVFTVEMQIPTTRVQTCIARMCALCARDDGRAIAALRCTLRRFRIRARARTDSVLFLTSLSSPGGLYGYSLPSVSHIRARARARFSRRSFSTSCSAVYTSSSLSSWPLRIFSSVC